MKPHQHTVLHQVFLSAEWFVLRWGSLFGIIVNKTWCINTVFYSFISGHLKHPQSICTYVKVEFWPRLCTELTLNSPKINILRYGVVFWWFWFEVFPPHILKFIIFWAGNKIFSLLQLHINLSKKNTLKNNPIHIFLPQTQAPSCHLQRKPDIFWPTGKVQKHFSFGKQQYRNSSEGTGHRGSCCCGVTLSSSRCARCATCQVWYPLKHRDASGRQREGWAATQDHSMALPPPRKRPSRTNPVPLGAFWLLVGGSLQLILLWRNTGGSLELHLLCN